MVTIKPIGRRDLKHIVSMLESDLPEQPSLLMPFLDSLRRMIVPIYQLNEWLPLPLKALPGIYVAMGGSTVLGAISLSRDGHSIERWRVENVLINPNVSVATDVGQQLVEYALNRYGAQGVETFLAQVDLHDNTGLALFKASGFRHCAQRHSYQLSLGKNPDIVIPSIGIGSIDQLREAIRSDGVKLKELYAETLPPEVRTSLRKKAQDLMNPWYQTLWEHGFWAHPYHRHWVVGSRYKDYLMGSLSIETQDYTHFNATLFCSPGWDDGLTLLAQLTLAHIAQHNKEAVITVPCFEFHKAKMAVLESLGFERIETTEILVRDYWQLSQTPLSALKNPLLLFSDKGKPSPA